MPKGSKHCPESSRPAGDMEGGMFQLSNNIASTLGGLARLPVWSSKTLVTAVVCRSLALLVYFEISIDLNGDGKDN